jgi:hypothetical protein
MQKCWGSTLIKGIGSILFLKSGLEKFCRKNYKNHPRSNNYEVCTAVARCFPNILDVMVLENVNLSSDRNWATVVWYNDTAVQISILSSVIYIRCQQCIFQLYVNFIQCMYMDLAVFNFNKKITFCVMNWIQYMSHHNLNRRWLDLFCYYYHIQCVCYHSTALGVIF